MPLAAGARLGIFEILAPLGKGGMGEVYRAKDTKLSREVAIKVLPETLKKDAPRLGRFQREATLLAALNHPHSASIYGFEEADGSPFLVLELAPGEDLSKRIRRGPIPVDEALEIARQIAEAIEAAHEKGIVHRDLKPSNVKVTTEGQVMVLDFGLAKAYADGASNDTGDDVSQSPTMSAPATQAGVILGTAAYMSPEQAKGKPLAKRADVWAFGVVLYEMCTGRRLFTGETASEVLASVIKDEPDWTSLPDACPAALRRLLRRCLEKPPERRLRDIGDARLEIGDALARPGDGAAAAPARLPQWLPWSLAAVFGIAAMAAWYASGSDPQQTARAAHVQVSLPIGVDLAVDTEHPVLALSPDGSQLVFVAEEGGIRRLYVREMTEPDARALPGTEGAASPFFSLDGDWIGFLAGASLNKVPAAGGVPVAMHAASGPSVSRGATWSTDDTAIIAGSANSGLARGSLRGDAVGSIGD